MEGHELTFRVTGGEPLDVREFSVEEQIGQLFTIQLTVLSANPDLDLEGLVGESATFDVAGRRAWYGVVRSFQQVRAEPNGLSTYRIVLVPRVWLLTQRRNHRIFQRMTEPMIVMQLLAQWQIPFQPRLDLASYSKRDYRVQYAESDFAFLSRMLEDAGITYWFETVGDQSMLILADSVAAGEEHAPIEYVDDASAVPPGNFATSVTVTRELRPGKYTVRDVDFRLASTHPLVASSIVAPKSIEEQLESFHYVPGAFLFEGQGDGTPTADDKLAARSSEREAQLLAQRRLEAKRSEARLYGFRTSALELRPGTRVCVTGHPRSDLGADHPILVTSTSLEGTATGRWTMQCEARPANMPYRPALNTPKPKVSGVETATVVGAEGDEIHTDEFGRVRVHFHWDRLSNRNDDSSCWIPVSQPWAGTGFGGINLPRVGQEVVVDFLGGDPDRPMVVGRVYTSPEPVPFKLPENKTQSGWKSNSTNQTGGYNEIMFEDLAGKELFRVQAEKDMHKLVKHDEESTVLHDRTRDVRNNEDVTIGRNRSHKVVGNERIHIGRNQQVTVGINRATSIGLIDSTIVGETYVMTVQPPGEGGPPAAAAPPTEQAKVEPKVTQPAEDDFPKIESSAVTTIFAKDGTIILDTGKGARIVLVEDRILIEGRIVDIVGRDKVTARGLKTGVAIAAPAPEGKNSFTGPTFKVECDDIALKGKTVDLTASGALTASGQKVLVAASAALDVKGSPIQLNGPGRPVARMGDSVNTVQILNGAEKVLIGGSSVNPISDLSPDEREEQGAVSKAKLLALRNHRTQLRDKITEIETYQRTPGLKRDDSEDFKALADARTDLNETEENLSKEELRNAQIEQEQAKAADPFPPNMHPMTKDKMREQAKERYKLENR